MREPSYHALKQLLLKYNPICSVHSKVKHKHLKQTSRIQDKTIHRNLGPTLPLGTSAAEVASAGSLRSVLEPPSSGLPTKHVPGLGAIVHNSLLCHGSLS